VRHKIGGEDDSLVKSVKEGQHVLGALLLHRALLEHSSRGRVAVAQPRDDLGVQGDRDAAWAVLASIAHNLVRWVGVFGLEANGPLVAKTIRRKFIALPGRLTDSGRRRHLHLPTKWPWATQWRECIARLVKLQT
jgi:hypothetical protein